MPALPLTEGEHQAQRARETLRLGPTAPIVDLATIVESTGVPVFFAPLPGKIAGLASRLDGHWYIVADSSTPNPGRLRFTLAHEFGHVWMGHTPAVDDDATLRGRSKDPQEVEANYFAAEFLMPRGLVEDMVGRHDDGDDAALVTALAAYAGTSLWVPLYRLQTLDLINRREREQLAARIESAQGPSGPDERLEAIAGSGKTLMPRDHDERAATLDELMAAEPPG